MALHAAQHYGVDVVGVTLSAEQRDFARARIAEAGMTDRIEIRLQDYRDIDESPFDAISSIGMSEHVGAAKLPEYARHLHELLVPGGRCSTTPSRRWCTDPNLAVGPRHSSTATSSPTARYYR